MDTLSMNVPFAESGREAKRSISRAVRHQPVKPAGPARCGALSLTKRIDNGKSRTSEPLEPKVI
jgi:hypothetical protein